MREEGKEGAGVQGESALASVRERERESMIDQTGRRGE